jgi:hypothetical protein
VFLRNSPVQRVDALGLVDFDVTEPQVVDNPNMWGVAWGIFHANDSISCDCFPSARRRGYWQMACKVTSRPTLEINKKRAAVIDELAGFWIPPTVERHEYNHFKVYRTCGVAYYGRCLGRLEGDYCLLGQCQNAALKATMEFAYDQTNYKKWENNQEYGQECKKRGLNRDCEPWLDYGRGSSETGRLRCRF